MNQEAKQFRPVQDDETDLGFIRDLFDKRWTIALFTAVACCMGLFYMQLVTPMYRAHAVIQVDESRSALLGLTDLLEVAPPTTTQIQILESRTVLGKAVDQLHLDISARPKSFPLIGRALVRTFGSGASLFSWILPSYSWADERIEVSLFDVPEELRGETFVITKLSPLSYKLSYEGEDLLEGTLGSRESLGNTTVQIDELEGYVGSQYLLSKKHRLDVINKLKRSLSASESVDETGIFDLYLLADSRSKAREILDAVVASYLEQNASNIAAQAKDSLGPLNEQLNIAKQRLDRAERALSAFKGDTVSVDLSLETQAVLQRKVSIDQELQRLVYLESELARRFTPQHPEYAALLEKRATLEAERARIEREAQRLPATQQEVLRLNRDVAINQQIYTQLLEQTQGLDIVSAGSVGSARLLDPAAVNKYPVTPKKLLMLILSLVLGFVAGVGFVLVQRAFFGGVKEPEEVEALGLPVNALIPRSVVQEQLDKATSVKILASTDPTDLTVEALRSLRTNLHFTMKGAKNNILAVTGAAAGVGKSFIASNLANLVAHGQSSTLLIDADMRKGKLGSAYSLSSKYGLSEYLAGKASIEEVVNSTDKAGSSLIARGHSPLNPSELLMGSRFEELLCWAADNYDLVIIDTPPILSVTDAAIIGQHVGALFLVVRFNHTTKREIKQAKSRFEQNGLRITGTVLNSVDTKEAEYYSYY